MTTTMISPDDSAAQLASQAEVRHQHEGLKLLLRAIEEVLASRAEHRESDQLSAAMIVLLTYLDKELRKHFDFEERGGFFADVIRVAPRMSRELDRLQRQHREFSDWSRTLLDLAYNAPKDTRRWADVEKQFGTFCARLTAHEQDENAMVQEAFSEDIGQAG